MKPYRLKLIACEIFYREFCFVIANSKNIIDVEFLTQGLHDIESMEMKKKLQDRIDAVDTDKYKAILLGYGLCNNGIEGLTTTKLPLVVPRAHDCITFFFGSKEKYKEYFDKNPGTYYKTTGWIERDTINMQIMHSHKMQKLGIDKSYEEYVKMYGEENAKFIMESLGKGIDNYTKYSYVDMNLATELKYDELTKMDAREKKWEFEHIIGDLRIFKALVDGDWDTNDFLIIEPSCKISVSYNDNIIKSEPL